MKELELLKAITQKIAQIDAKITKLNGLEEINNQLFEQEELILSLQDGLQEIKMTMEVKHIENMNSDDMLLRSILDKNSLHYK